MRPMPIVSMEEVVAQLSERGKMEWELASVKATLAKVLADPGEVAESGHVPPESEPATIPATNQLTTPE